MSKIYSVQLLYGIFVFRCFAFIAFIKSDDITEYIYPCADRLAAALCVSHYRVEKRSILRNTALWRVLV